MTLVSTIVSKKRVLSGESVGYNAVFKAISNTMIAVVIGGYYDGIMRNMVGQEVLVNGTKCPIIAVCMDTFMIDIGKIHAKVGDNVIIIGTSGKHTIKASDIAYKCNTISYEVLTNIKATRAERIYYI